jgi:hypothetical protein
MAVLNGRGRIVVGKRVFMHDGCARDQKERIKA